MMCFGPVTLRSCQKARLGHEPCAGLHLAELARFFVGCEIPRECLLELENDATAHDTDTVDGVDQGLGLATENVSARELEHCTRLVPIATQLNRRCMSRS